MLVSSKDARPSGNHWGDYAAEDVHPYQSISQPNFPQRRFSDGPSFSNYHTVEDVVLDQQFSQSRQFGGPSCSNYHAAEGVVLDQPFSWACLPYSRGHSGSAPFSNYHPAEDVVLDQPFSRSSLPKRRRRFDSRRSPSYANHDAAEDVVLGELFSRSSFPQSRRRSGSPSYSSFRRDSTKYRSNYREKDSRNFGRKHQYHAKRRKDSRSIRDLSPKHNRNSLESSPAMKGRFTSKRGFKKPIVNYAKVDSQAKKPVRQTNVDKLFEPSYAPKVGTPVLKNVNSANRIESKCSKDNEDVASSAAELAAKLSKDNAEASLTKEPTDQMIPTKEDHKEVVGYKEQKKNREADAVPHGSSPYHNLRQNSRKYKSYFEAKHPRNVKRKHQNHAERHQDSRSIRDLSPKHNRNGLESSPAMKGFKKPIADHAKFDGQAEKPDRQTNVDKSDEPSYTPKVDTPVLKNVNLKNKMESKCLKDDREVDSFAAELPAKLSEDNAKVSLAKEPTEQMIPRKEDHKELAECVKQIQHNEAGDVQHGSSPYHDSRMKDLNVKSLAKGESRKRDLHAKGSSQDDASSCYVMLMKDHKIICRTKCTNPPIQPSSSWNVDIVKRKSIEGLYDLPQFLLFPAFEDSLQKSEWIKFLTFLSRYNKVASVVFDNLKIHVYPPECTKSSETDDGLYFAHAVVAYELQELCDTSVDQRHATSGAIKTVFENEGQKSPRIHSVPQTPCINNGPVFGSVTNIKRSSSAEKGTCSSVSKCHEAVDSLQPFSAKDDVAAERRFVRTDPSYLKTLGQAHSGWIFGAIAELVDNSKDARASRLEIAVESIYDKTVGCTIPMLAVTDDGVGMNHQEILRMISFGHKQPDEDNLDCIGRFGIGFKTGSMRLGRDALVLTQTANSRSIAFLSQSLNEGKDNLEIPVVSYRRQAQCMEIDTNFQSEALAKYNLNTMKEFSPFDEYLIGEKSGQFKGKTGTQIYIWNLDKWGSAYTLEWQEGMRGGSSFHQGDIYIRSRRVRTRPGQISRKVHLDYSLRSYLEVIFLEPRMKIYVQGSPVKTRPLAKSLNNTAVINGEIMGKQVQLTIGRCQVEWDEANCGIFLYWHGRLIEAYKRVGGMIHSVDMGRGVIGVIDVTELMDDGNGGVWVHSNKQGFQDCEPYACLEEWLGKKADEYWDKNFDPVQLKKRNARYKPDNEWVQCDKCRKWRMLSDGFDTKNLPKEWFCYMEPFSGRCEMPEQKTKPGEITVGLKRSNDDPSIAADCKGGFLVDNDTRVVEGNGQEESTQLAADDVENPLLKRLRRGPPRTSRKQLNRS